MISKMKSFIKKNVIISIFILLCFIIISSYTYIKFMPSWFSKADTYNVVKQVFLTNKGYSNELSKHMSQQVFKTTNIYSAYPLNNKKTYNVDFSLKENSQNKFLSIVYVKMTYSVKIFDLQNKLVGASLDIPITFTIKNINGNWYITEKEEPA